MYHNVLVEEVAIFLKFYTYFSSAVPTALLVSNQRVNLFLNNIIQLKRYKAHLRI